MKLEWLFVWWNAVYSIPLAFVLLFLTITSVVGIAGGALEGLSHGHGDSDVDLDADVDIDAEADVDLDADGDLDADSAHSPEHGHSHELSPIAALLVFLGVGKAPFVLTFQVLFLLWGLFGLGLHQAFKAAGPFALAWSVPSTLVLSLLGTRLFAAIFGRIFGALEMPAVKRNDLVGRTGQVVYTVNAEEGTVHVRDPEGALQRVRARTPNGTLEAGRQIIVVGYDPRLNLYEIDDVSAFVDRP